MSIEIGILVAVIALGLNVGTFLYGRHSAARSAGAHEARTSARLEVVERTTEDHRCKFAKIWERIDELRFGAASIQGELKQIQATLAEMRIDVRKLLERGCGET